MERHGEANLSRRDQVLEEPKLLTVAGGMSEVKKCRVEGGTVMLGF